MPNNIPNIFWRTLYAKVLGAELLELGTSRNTTSTEECEEARGLMAGANYSYNICIAKASFSILQLE